MSLRFEFDEVKSVNKDYQCGLLTYVFIRFHILNHVSIVAVALLFVSGKWRNI